MNDNIKIALDARMLKKSGIGTCIAHWLKHVGYTIAIGNEDDLNEFSIPHKISFTQKNYSIKEQLFFPYRLLKKECPDVLHVPHCNIPLFYRGKLLVTIHDLTHLIYPQFLPSKLALIYFKFMFWFVSKRADKIITVSQNTKKDIIRFFKTPEEKIEVVYSGVGREFQKKERAAYAYLYEKFNIPRDKKILLYVGNLLPHKNLSMLLKAFAQMKSRKECCLVLVGKAFENRSFQMPEKELNIENLTRYTGMVSQGDLVNFYNLADLFILPSLYEGFGLPILEAFACGTPVACSNTSSLPEVGGEFASYFDPENENDIAEILEQSLHLKNKNPEALITWAKNFSWENSSKRIYEIAQKLARE